MLFHIDNLHPNVEIGEELPMTSPPANAERFRRAAEKCRELAEEATSPLDKEAWLRLAEDWLKLAQQADEDTRFGRR
ncbi:hypothetical protein MTR72_39920 [Bradyrhizobium sp. ISRA442]|uniref:hypothetical protein n=1 Tax=Bradyrhizobium sp. ISRA442 TaxID=2866197 RepID=UPI00311B3C81